MKKIFLVGALCALSMNASADLIYLNATVTFGGVVPDYDDSALTSSLLSGVNANDLANTGLGGINNAGLFVETFDIATQLGTNLGVDSPFGAGIQDFNSSKGDNSKCAVNGSGSGVLTTGSFSVREGDLKKVALIGYKDNCFGYTPEDGLSTGTVTIDFNPILASATDLSGKEMGMDYIGFYWATIDKYNTFTFRNNGVDIVSITGQHLRDNIANLQLGSTSQYVNVFFNDGVYFDEVEVVSTTRAAEFDNIVNRIVEVPEPSTFAIFALGIMGLAARRFKKKS